MLTHDVRGCQAAGVRVLGMILSAIVVLIGSGCSTGDEPDPNAKERRRIECRDLRWDVINLVESQAEATIWDNKLYKTDIQIPRKLLSNGKPVKFDKMTEAQRDIYREWRDGDSDRPNVAYLESGKKKLQEVRRAAEQLDILDRCLGDVP